MPGMTVTRTHIRKARLYQANYNTVHGHMIPSVAGLAKVLRIPRSTLKGVAIPDTDGSRINPEQQALKDELISILGEINTEQEVVLLNGGLNGDMNSNIVKLALGKHGYSEKHVNEHTGAEGGPISGKWEVVFVDP